jgi:hypothetical protein
VFVLDDNNVPVSAAQALDNTTLAQLLSKTSLQFNLVDFQVLNNGNINALDLSGTIYVLNVASNGIWSLVSTIPSPNPTETSALGFSINFLLDSRDDYQM